MSLCGLQLQESGVQCLMPPVMAFAEDESGSVTNLGIPKEAHAALSAVCRRRNWNRRGVVGQLIKHFLAFDPSLQLLLLDPDIPARDKVELSRLILQRLDQAPPVGEDDPIMVVKDGTAAPLDQAEDAPPDLRHPAAPKRPKRRRRNRS
jgi:hypothetical protein